MGSRFVDVNKGYLEGIRTKFPDMRGVRFDHPQTTWPGFSSGPNGRYEATDPFRRNALFQESEHP